MKIKNSNGRSRSVESIRMILFPSSLHLIILVVVALLERRYIVTRISAVDAAAATAAFVGINPSQTKHHNNHQQHIPSPARVSQSYFGINNKHWKSHRSVRLMSVSDKNNNNNNVRGNSLLLEKNDTIVPSSTSQSLINELKDSASHDTNLQHAIDVDFETNGLYQETDDNNNKEYIVLAKKEEPGDKDEIIQAIKQVQKELWKNEPTFPFGTILSRTFDTVEDIVVHARRVPYDYGWINDDDLLQTDRETVVVLGSGWAAHAYLKVVDTYKQRIIVVSPSNHFVFTPMLASASVGTVEYRSMTEAVRASNPMIDNYIEGSATAIDVKLKTLTVELKSILESTSAPADSSYNKKPEPITIKYDKLVVAVGCKVADSMVPGAREYALRLKSCDDARRLRTAVGEAFEYASRPDVREDTEDDDDDDDDKLTNVSSNPDEKIRRQKERQRRVTFCIVGGGPTGVELAGELADFVQDICKPRVGAYPSLKDDVRIIVIHGGPKLVPQFDESLTQSAYQALTEKSGVDVRLNTNVKEVGDGYVTISTKGSDTEEIIPCGVCVWAAGTEQVPFIAKLLDQLPDDARAKGGKVVVDKWLRCPMEDPELLGSILVMGDAAAFMDHEDGTYLPQTAQVAAQQGAYVARLLDRNYNLSVTPPTLIAETVDNDADLSMFDLWLKLRGLEKAEGFKFLNLGLLAYVGQGQALTQVQIGDVQLASYAGKTAFVLWRSVYLVKQVATRNRVLVTFDWIKSAIFGRDITRL